MASLRLREELIFATSFVINGKANLHLDTFASVATLCLAASAEGPHALTLPAWLKIGVDFCGLKAREAEMLFHLFEATLRGTTRDAFVPATAHKFVVFIFCVLLRQATLSKRSKLAMDESWPADRRPDDVEANIRAFFSSYVNLLVTALSIPAGGGAAAALDPSNMTVPAEALEALAYLIAPDQTLDAPPVEGLCQQLRVGAGDPVLVVAGAVGRFVEAFEGGARSIALSPAGDRQPATPQGPADAGAAYSYSEAANVVRIDGAVRAGLCVVLGRDHRPATLLVANCHNCTLFVLGPLAHATVCACRGLKLVLGPVGGVLCVAGCSRVSVSGLAGFLRVNATEDSTLYVSARHSAVHDSGNKATRAAPYNYVYPGLEDAIARAGLVDVCQAAEDFRTETFGPLGLGSVERLVFLEPTQFCTQVVPFASRLLEGPTATLPLVLPQVYRLAMAERTDKLQSIAQKLGAPGVSEEQRQQFDAYCREVFMNWVRERGLAAELVEVSTARVHEIE